MSELKNISKEEMPTYRAIEDRFNYLFNAINSLEETLDEFQGAGSKEAKDSAEKARDTVVNTWSTTPSRLNVAAERIYKLNDRLRNMFN